MTDCKNCNETGCGEAAAKKTPEMISFAAHEAIMDRLEMRHKEHIDASEKDKKRWMIAFFVTLALFFVAICGFIIYESQFETISYQQDGEGLNNVNVGEQGDINYGAEGNDQEEEKK